MGFASKLVLLLLVVGGAVLFQKFNDFSKPLPAPKLDFDEYWGPGSKSAYKEDKSIKPFKINYSNEINELKERLGRPIKFQEPLEGVGFEYGFNTKTLKKVIKSWKDDYLSRWADRQTFLNKYPQFTTQVQGLNLHYLHVKPTNDKKNPKKVLPLILLHGWPGSVREFYEIIPKLTTPNDKSDYVFEVIAPSLPGYGWSQGASKKGFGPAQVAIVLRNLMLRIGHQKFLIQGGDWGSIIGSHMATLFPDNALGYHSNFCQADSALARIKSVIASFYPSYFVEEKFTAFHFPLSDNFFTLLEESGYFHIQATKPDTIGTALTANPVGLAAYILEKFSTWTNIEYRKLEDGGLEKRFTMDKLFDNLMIYYLSNSITTSQRLYSEFATRAQAGLELNRVPTSVPTACARFRHDLSHALDWQLKDKYTNLVHSTYYPDGGHFAALEVPNVLYQDILEFVGKLQKQKFV